jgi:hypothetical protein
MSSSRNTPFSFSPEARALLGTPNRLNEDVRTAFPNLFGAAFGDNLAYINDGRLGPGAMVRWRAQPPIRAGTPVGIFSGHVVTEWHRRDTNTLPLPPLHTHGVCTRLSVHASASVGRSPNPTNAALYNHHCTEPTLRGEWWTTGQIPCLVALSVYDLVPGDLLFYSYKGTISSIHHITIYAGNDMMWEANSKGKGLLFSRIDSIKGLMPFGGRV